MCDCLVCDGKGAFIVWVYSSNHTRTPPPKPAKLVSWNLTIFIYLEIPTNNDSYQNV